MIYVPKPCPFRANSFSRACGKLSVKNTYYTCPEGHRWWLPNDGPQTRFLASSVHEVLYGGAAGGGKSMALAMMPLRWSTNPFFNGIIFRRETGQLVELKRYCSEWFPHVIPGARSRNDGKGVVWEFPAGAILRLAHCKDDDDANAYNGQEIPWIGFDELTHFTWYQYKEIKARCRSTKPGLPRFIRSTSNPGGPGHQWVLKRWGAWLNPKFETKSGDGTFEVGGEKVHTTYGLVSRPGHPLLNPGETAWILKPDGLDEEYYVPKGTVGALSRTFIPAMLSDNPVLVATDPNYRAVLADNDQVRREQLERGNWLIVPAAGLYFKREWFKLYCPDPNCPACLATNVADPERVRFHNPKGHSVRYWDRASTSEPKPTDTNDPDYTVGLHGIRDGDDCFFGSLIRFRKSPGGNENEIREAADSDGVETMIALEQDPGAAGKFEIHHYLTALEGYQVVPVLPSGDKVVRAGPASTRCQAGRLFLYAHAEWLDDFFNELESFPTEGIHDDQVDALSGCYFMLHRMGGPTSDGQVHRNEETHSINAGSFG